MTTDTGKAPQITKFSLSDLKKIAGVEGSDSAVECLIAHSESSLDVLHFPCRIDALIIGVGTEGETTFSSNLQEYSLRRNSLFLYAPNSIIHTPGDQRFKAHIMAITSEFIRRMNINTTPMIPLLIQFAATPCIQLGEADAKALCALIAQLETEINSSEAPFAQEVISGLVSILVYKAGNLLAQHSEQADKLSAKNRAESYFARFMQLLGEHYKAERSVGFYARQLCITPKYLTTLIRRLSGKSVSEWIDESVILEAKTLLKHSDMSIQEIAYDLNFPNQSFFGSYFKRNTGFSPSHYKAKQ